MESTPDPSHATQRPKRPRSAGSAAAVDMTTSPRDLRRALLSHGPCGPALPLHRRPDGSVCFCLVFLLTNLLVSHGRDRHLSAKISPRLGSPCLPAAGLLQVLSCLGALI